MDSLGVTSIIYVLLLKLMYESLVRFFRSGTWNIKDASIKWVSIVSKNAGRIIRVEGSAVLTGDSLNNQGGPPDTRGETPAPGVRKQLKCGIYIWATVWLRKRTDRVEEKDFFIPLTNELQDGVKAIMS